MIPCSSSLLYLSDLLPPSSLPDRERSISYTSHAAIYSHTSFRSLVMYNICSKSRKRIAHCTYIQHVTCLEREHRRLLAVAEQVDEGLGDEEANGDTDRNSDHSGSNLCRAALRGDSACL